MVLDRLGQQTTSTRPGPPGRPSPGEVVDSRAAAPRPRDATRAVRRPWTHPTAASSTSQPTIRMKIRYSSRNDTSRDHPRRAADLPSAQGHSLAPASGTAQGAVRRSKGSAAATIESRWPRPPACRDAPSSATSAADELPLLQRQRRAGLRPPAGLSGDQPLAAALEARRPDLSPGVGPRWRRRLRRARQRRRAARRHRPPAARNARAGARKSGAAAHERGHRWLELLRATFRRPAAGPHRTQPRGSTIRARALITAAPSRASTPRPARPGHEGLDHDQAPLSTRRCKAVALHQVRRRTSVATRAAPRRSGSPQRAMSDTPIHDTP